MIPSVAILVGGEKKTNFICIKQTNKIAPQYGNMYGLIQLMGGAMIILALFT